MGWKIGDKPLVDPKDIDNILVEQDGKTSRTTWAKVKAFFLGTTALTTNDKTITGAIEELKGNVDSNTASLSDVANKIALRPIMTTSNLTYYVNVSTGLDTNDGLTVGTSFKTIQHAFNVLPQIINHNIIINVASGTYPEIVNIIGFSGKGNITIKGGTTYSESANYLATRFMILSVSLPITIVGMSTNITDSYASGFSCSNTHYVKIDNCSCTSNATTTSGRGVGSALGSYVEVSNSLFSNRYVGLQSSQGGLLYSTNNIGAGNTIGLQSDSGGTLCKQGTQPTGTTAEVYQDGGVIR